jgi:transcriptional regulator with PAS, ATPase and Fis domain
LVDHFMDRHRASGRAVGDLSTAARESLMAYDWPGNVRQLQNEVERFLIMAGPHEVIQPEHLSPQVRGRAAAVPAQQPPEIPEGMNLKDAIVALEKRLISSSLKARGGNKSDSARELGISRSSLIAKVKEYKLED